MAVTPVVWAPACFDAPELEQWRTGEVAACADCTPSWHTTSRAAGRCNGVPGFLTRDLGVEEDEPMETPEAAAVVEAAEITGRRRVTVVAPCPTCVHARVCRLRPADELDVRVSLPALADELDVTLTATVDCMEYARSPKAKAGPAVDRPRKTISPEARERLRAGAAKTQEILAARRKAAAS